MSESFLVVGWENCRYAQQAMEDLRLAGKKFHFLDEHRYGPVLCSDLPTWSGNSGPGPKWRSPHIFRMDGPAKLTYIGGSSDLERYLIAENQPEKRKRCRLYLGRVICE